MSYTNQRKIETTPEEGFLTALSRIAAAINSSLELEEVLTLLCREVVNIFDITGAAIYIFNPPTMELHLKASNGIDPTDISVIPIEQRISHFVGYSFWNGRSLITGVKGGKVTGDRNLKIHVPEVYTRHGLKSFLAMPLIRDVQGLGVLLLVSSKEDRFSREDLKRAGMLADHAAVAVKNAMLFEKEKYKSEQLKLAIQEAHHRIKNNLQTVAVLLSLHMYECEEPKAKQALDESIQRISAISLVHDLLSKESDVRVINLRELLDKLITIVTTASSIPGSTAAITVEAEDVLVSSKRATAVALIAHELLANALQHGIRQNSGGRILVALRKTGNRITFSVEDNGAGLPEEFDVTKHSRIGLGVVRMLVERELAGHIEFSRCTPGTRAAVYFDDAGVAGDG